MQLTRFTDLSLRALMYLAWKPEGDAANVGMMARAYRVPENHMVKVVHHLGRIGLVTTTRGRNGGVKLALSPEEIRIGEVVKLTESTFDLVDCEAPEPCPLKTACRLKTALDDAMAGFIAHLNQFTLADVTKGEFGRRALRQAVDANALPVLAGSAISNPPL
jgi:Rrf2 family nitric oxide-sensitive transcriptional repressor